MKSINLDALAGATAALMPLMDADVRPEAFADAVVVQIKRLALDPEAEEASFLAAQGLLWRKTSDVYLAQANASENVDTRRKFFEMARAASIEARESLRMLTEARSRVLREQRRLPQVEGANLVVNPKTLSDAIFTAKMMLQGQMGWTFMTLDEQKKALLEAERLVTWCILFNEDWREKLPGIPPSANERMLTEALAWNAKIVARVESGVTFN